MNVPNDTSFFAICDFCTISLITEIYWRGIHFRDFLTLQIYVKVKSSWINRCMHCRLKFKTLWLQGNHCTTPPLILYVKKSDLTFSLVYILDPIDGDRRRYNSGSGSCHSTVGGFGSGHGFVSTVPAGDVSVVPRPVLVLDDGVDLGAGWLWRDGRLWQTRSHREQTAVEWDIGEHNLPRGRHIRREETRNLLVQIVGGLRVDGRFPLHHPIADRTLRRRSCLLLLLLYLHGQTEC